MPLPQILEAPNLLSLVRIALLFPAAYYLAQPDDISTLICLAIVAVAGISDGLDGYLARRMGKVSKLGITLDPVADKIFAGGLVIMLVLYRDFPVWLAGVIVGRDLLIVALGSWLIKDTDVVLPSNLAGKYAFSAIVVLLSCYIIRFDFGILLFTYLTLITIALSLICYASVFVRLRKGLPLPKSKDTPAWRLFRIIFTTAVACWFFARLYLDLFR